MNEPKRPTPDQRIAAINALHEAEEAGRPFSARVDAVIAALEARPAPPPDMAELAHCLERALDALERRLATEADDAPDRAIVRAGRAALGLPPAEPGP